MLRYKGGINAYFDADNLQVRARPFVSIKSSYATTSSPLLIAVSSQTISLQKLSEGIAASCCVLLVLNNETLDSQWCKHEVECARSLNIPLICIIDADKEIVRTVIDG